MNELKKSEDMDLYKRFLKGDNFAFEDIMKKYRKNIINFILKYVNNLEIAEDLSQDVFVYILMNKKEYDFKHTLKSYLFLIAKCRALNYIKKKKNIVPFDENYMKDCVNNLDIDMNLIKEENEKTMEIAIKKLRKDYQQVLFLRDIENFSYKEICEILGKRMTQVKILIYRARKKLKENLNEEEFIC